METGSRPNRNKHCNEWTFWFNSLFMVWNLGDFQVPGIFRYTSHASDDINCLLSKWMKSFKCGGTSQIVVKLVTRVGKQHLFRNQSLQDFPKWKDMSWTEKAKAFFIERERFYLYTCIHFQTHVHLLQQPSPIPVLPNVVILARYCESYWKAPPGASCSS